MLAGQLWRRFALFSGGAFGFANGDHEFSLLTRELAPAGRPATTSDLGEVLAHFGREGKLLGSHQSIVSGLRWSGASPKLHLAP